MGHNLEDVKLGWKKFFLSIKFNRGMIATNRGMIATNFMIIYYVLSLFLGQAGICTDFHMANWYNFTKSCQ